jgi:hypothetical protein
MNLMEEVLVLRLLAGLALGFWFHARSKDALK